MKISPQLYPIAQSLQVIHTPQVIEKSIASYAPKLLPIKSTKRCKESFHRTDNTPKFARHGMLFLSV